MLTDRELQVLVLRGRGLTQIEIAAKLSITQGAVSRFEANAREKINDALVALAVIGKLRIPHNRTASGADEIVQRMKRWKQ